MKNETGKNITDKKPSRRKYIFGIIVPVFLFVFICVVILINYESKPDPASEAKIREAASLWLFEEIIRPGTVGQFDSLYKLAKEPNELTDEDFAKFVFFTISGPMERSLFVELADIKLLEKFKNLKYLDLSYVHYPKKAIPKWMKILSKLGIMNLNERYALDLSPLEKLHNLQELDLHGSQFKNIEPLGSLTNLQSLNLLGTLVTDLEPIKNLKNLRELNVTRTGVSNLKPLQGLKNLKRLYIRDCPNITDEQMDELQETLLELEIYSKFLKHGYLIPYRIE